MIDIIVMTSLFISMVLTIIRLIQGPTIYDRILAVNVFGTITVIIIVLFGFYFDYVEAFDISLVYALINFVTIIALLKYFRSKSFAKE
jgi:multicomponent Na+:H+ antiporter subunit F